MSDKLAQSSRVKTSQNDVKFNDLTQSDALSLSQSNSSFQLNQKKHYVSTETYLSQIEQKYAKLDKKKNQKWNPRLPSVNSSEYIMRNHDDKSFATNQDKHQIPDKFASIPVAKSPPTKTPNNEPQPPPQINVFAPQKTASFQPTPQNQPQSNVRILPQPQPAEILNHSIHHDHSVEMHIPEDLSLSKGVSERGSPAVTSKQEILESKQRFFDLCNRIKSQLPAGHKAANLLVAQLYAQAQVEKVQEAQWESWIRNKINQVK